MSFTLEKWYLDLVTDDGTALVGYAVDVRWLGIEVRLASRLRVDAAGGRDELTSRGEAARPEIRNGRLSWASGALNLQGVWRGLDAPIAHTLLSSPAGSIEWSCPMPRARAAVALPSGRYEGLGYAEHLRMSLPPWTVPAHTVRWGRHLSDRHALVWIEREGAAPMQAAWLDGVPEPEASVGPTGVAGLSGGRALRWHTSRELTNRSVGDTIAGIAPALATLIAGRLAGMREHKRLSVSTLVAPDGRALDQGWAIHEVLTW